MSTTLHIKGYLLQLLATRAAMWDSEIAEAVMAEYGLAGEYWHGTVRLTLTDLYSGGLLDEVEATLAPTEDKLLFKYALNDFGRDRMRQSGLLQGTSA